MRFPPVRRSAAAPQAREIQTSAELSAEMQRKLLILVSSMTLASAVSYIGYFAWIGLWLSVGRGVFAMALALSVLGYGLHTRRYPVALNALSIALFVTFGLACYLQDGVSSPALWWMLTPPLMSLLAGSLRIGSALFAAFLLHAVVLYLHGPGSWGTVSLMAHDRELQTLLTVVFSTIFLGVVIGMGHLWLSQVQRTLEQARLAALEATDVKARFLSNMSHEIRTPLNGMIGATQMLRRQKMSALQRRQLVGVQEHSAKMLMSLVNDILDYSKLEARKVRVEHAQTTLRSLVFNVNELFSVAAFERGIELTSGYDRAMPARVLADPTRIRQILGNLVSNAVKFTEQGGVHLHLGFEANPGVPHRAGTVWVRFDVTDTGPGVASDAVANLFRPFEQADGSITRRYGGSGLGLSISQELARLMGGRIEVDSQVGVGSTFSLVLPLEGATASPTPTPPTRAPLGRVLVATRSPGLWQHVQLQLEELGVACDCLAERPTLSAVYRSRAAYVLIDAALLGRDEAAMATTCSELAGAGMRVAVIAPLAGDVPLQSHPNVALLYKPVRRGGLREFVFGDHAQNLRDSHETPHGIESAYTELDPPVSPTTPARTLKVLVAEDNPINQLIAQTMLDDMSASVTAVHNGREALEALTHTQFDVILMDVQMPVMDGITTTRLLREHEKRDRRTPTPVIAITGNNALDDRLACLEAGMNTFLTKPYTFEQLRSAMRESAAVA